MTWAECERFYGFFKNGEADKVDFTMSLFALRNFESSRLAQHGKPNEVRKYFNELRKSNDGNQENDIDDQFKGVTFVE